MTRTLRWTLLGLLICLLITGLLPNSFLTGAAIRVAPAATATAAPIYTPQSVMLPFMPLSCTTTSCGKGVPATAAPVLPVAAAAALVGALSLVAASRVIRRRRTAAGTLPRGDVMGLFRPPRFS
jgi:hypothetical protein